MNRGRRLASILVVASLGLGSLVGCQSESGKAAFVGDTTITEDRVSRVFDDVVAKRPKQEKPTPEASAAPSAEPSPTAEPAPPVTRQEVVDLLVSLELARRIVKEKNLPPAPEPIDPEAVAQARSLPADSEYVKLAAEWYELQAVILKNEAETQPSAQLTDEGITKVYDALVKIGAIQPGAPVEEMRQAIVQLPSAVSGIQVAKALGDAVAQADTKVNPKYDPVSAPVYLNTGQNLIFFNLPYITSDLVTDVAS